MKLYSTSLAIGLAAAGIAAWVAGGTLGAGLLLGALVGLGISAVAVAKQRRALVEDPRRAMTIFGLAALVKLLALGVGGALLRYVDALAVRADWVGFLIALPVAALWVSTLGAIDNMKVLERRAA